MVNELVQVVSQLGFPIFVAGYMMLKQTKETELMTDTLIELKFAIQGLNVESKERK